MFNFRSIELLGQCDHEKDDLFNDLNTIYNQVLNDDLNCVDLQTVPNESGELCHKSSDVQFIEQSNDNDEQTNLRTDDSILCKAHSNIHLNNSVDNVNNSRTNDLENHQTDDDNQYLFSNLINDQLILNCKDFISFANQNLHDFLLYDKDRINFQGDLVSSKRKLDNKPKFCDNVNNGTTSGYTLTNTSMNTSIASSSNCTSNASSIKSSSATSTPTRTNSTSSANVLNFKSLIFDRSKRKLLKILLKLKEEEKNENNDLNGIQIRKDCQLLSRYIKEEKLSHLQLKLYPHNQGYSISLKKICDKNSSKNSNKASNIKVLETIKLPYDETELLEYIDNEQIPPMLLDVLDSNCENDEHLDLFHFGRLFIEIQDFRKNANVNNPNYESKFVLLKPTVQTILNDVEKLTNCPTSRNWSNNDKLELESKLVMATSDPICLDPNPLTFLSSNQLNYEKKWLNDDRIKSICKKSSQAYLNQVDKFSQLPAPKNLELFDFIKRKHSDRHVDKAKEKLNKSINDHIFVKEKQLPIPKSCLDDVQKLSKSIEMPNQINDSMTKLEEYVMEHTEPQRTFSTTTISIFYRQIDDTYYGQLKVEKILSKLLPNQTTSQTSQTNSSCPFRLGNKILTKKYIEQFIEILSEHGRKCIKITKKKPGEPPRVNYTKKFLNNGISNHLQNQINFNDNNSIPIKKIKVTSSNPVVNGSAVNANYVDNSIDYNTNYNLNSSLNSSNQNMLSVSNNMSNMTNQNQQININIRSKNEMNQHPILSSNLINQHHVSNDGLSGQNIATQNSNQIRPKMANDTQGNNMGNVTSLNTVMNSNISGLNNSMNSMISSTPELSIPTKSPYAQMSILEKNSNNQIHQQQKQQPQQSNNLIANNPILNNLITNNTISTNLVQNNFIQLNTKAAKNINISNGFVNETIQVNHQQNANQQQPLTNTTNQTAYIESGSLNQNLNANLNLNPITISPIATSLNNLNRLNSGKNETVAVILTTNPLPNTNFISTNNAHNSAKNNSIIQISSSGQTTSTTTSLPTGMSTGVNLSSLSLGRGQNLRVHNLVSLANVQGTNQCIALPISLMMTSPNSITNTQANNQQNLNGNMVVGLQSHQSKVGGDHQQTTNHQNVVLINNVDHTGNQIAYQSHQTGQHFSISGSTLNNINCRNQNIQHTGTTTANLLQSTNLHLTNHQQQGPIAIHLTATNPLDQTQQSTAAIQPIGSQQVLTLQKND